MASINVYVVLLVVIVAGVLIGGRDAPKDTQTPIVEGEIVFSNNTTPMDNTSFVAVVLEPLPTLLATETPVPSRPVSSQMVIVQASTPLPVPTPPTIPPLPTQSVP